MRGGTVLAMKVLRATIHAELPIPMAKRLTKSRLQVGVAADATPAAALITSPAMMLDLCPTRSTATATKSTEQVTPMNWAPTIAPTAAAGAPSESVYSGSMLSAIELTAPRIHCGRSIGSSSDLARSRNDGGCASVAPRHILPTRSPRGRFTVFNTVFKCTGILHRYPQSLRYVTIRDRYHRRYAYRPSYI